jgi:hypothetical protein
VQTGKEFTLKVVVENAGYSTAYSTQAVFASADLVPTKTGGVAALGVVAFDDEIEASQSFLVTAQLGGQSFIAIDLTLTYYDDKGTTYSDKFTLSIPVSGGASSGIVYPTATPTGVKSSQLVITSYSASVDPLQPGEQFELKMGVQNVGNVKAQRVTMIVGASAGRRLRRWRRVYELCACRSFECSIPGRYCERRNDPGEPEFDRQRIYESGCLSAKDQLFLSE